MCNGILFSLDADFAHQALARALYAKSQLVILDDVLSALDKTTEEHVFNALFGHDGLLCGKTVLLSTNDGIILL